MNLLKDDSEIVAVKPVQTEQPTTPSVTDGTAQPEVNAPSITVSEGTSNGPIKIKPLGTSDDETTVDTTASTDTAATDDSEADSTEEAFGTLTLSAVNASTQQPMNADFLIQNDSGDAIAQVKSTASSTVSLPAGSYKITVNQGESKIVRYLGVKSGQVGAETFELDVPVAETNTATVATTPSGPAAVAPTASAPTAVVIDEPVTQAPASSDTATTVTSTAAPSQTPRQNSATPSTTTTSTTATTSSASTTASTASAEASDTTEKPAATGGLRVSALTKEGNRPMTASFYIQRLNGENVANIKNVNTHQFNLPAGAYRITARAENVRMVKQVTVIAARGMHEVFNMPSTVTTVTGSTATPAATPAPAPAPTSAATPVEPESADTGRLELFARDASNNKPVRSNFYIQTPQGKLVTSKTYVESIGYKLPVAQYKVTARATGYKNKVITLNVRKDQTRRETFQMELVAPAVQTPPVQAPVPAPVVVPKPTVVAPPVAPVAAPVQAAPQNTRPNNRGGLRVNVVSPTGIPLKADILVLRRNGTPVKRAINASTADFDLAPRNFVLRVRHGGYVTNQQVNIQAGKMAIKNITFDLNQGFR
ncbi:hypothetical protein EOL70_02500 [Leucothrix sargassi]|nr:hypothetical protein EOL70_02500 [Leucothrix sargassi]